MGLLLGYKMRNASTDGREQLFVRSGIAWGELEELRTGWLDLDTTHQNSLVSQEREPEPVPVVVHLENSRLIIHLPFCFF